ncbi:MAG TPA: DUF1566 domain-containing protein [Gammaproteobacteria bacterium]|nr:DUF1566 domain-containing protein [Gammaproteobacteria bacterium]
MLKQLTLTLIIFSSPLMAADESICSSPPNEKNIPATTPTAQFDFTETGNFVTDKKTGLMWTRCPLGYQWNTVNNSCAVSSNGGKMSWLSALEFVRDNKAAASDNAYLGFSDWRLPNIKELASIIERRCASRAINAQIFGLDAVGAYWSNTHSASSPDLIWVVVFGESVDILAGTIAGRVTAVDATEEFFVRLVRDTNVTP